MTFERIYLDTNTIIVAFEWQDKTADLLTEFFSLARARKPKGLVTSQLTFAELLVLPYRDDDREAIHTYESLMKGHAWLDVLPVDDAVLRYAARIRAINKGLKLPDAIHVATAIGVGCSHILTADNDMRGRYEVSLVDDPGYPGPDSMEILRPDNATLTSLIESLS